MSNIILDSDYYKNWYKYAHLEESSKKKYTVTLKKFGDFLLENDFYGELNFDEFYYYEGSNDYASIDENYINQFIEELKDQDAPDTVLYDSITALRNFFSVLEKYKLIKNDPLRYFPNPYYSRKNIDYSLTLEQCKTLLVIAYNLDPFSKKYYTLLLLLLITGIRNQELRKMKASQIDFEKKTILIDKGNKTSVKTVYMTSSLSNQLEMYLTHPIWLEWSQGKDKEVFFNKGRTLSAESLQGIIDKICSYANINKRVTPHIFRHSMATLLLNVGVDLMTIKRQLRHNRLATTLRYLPKSKEVSDAQEQLAQSLGINELIMK